MKNISPFITIVKASDPGQLLADVGKLLCEHHDLYTPLFVSHEGLLCQRMTPVLCLYEYKLIVASDLDDLETQERNLGELGFDYMFNTVMWQGKYLQWMSRMNSSGLLVKNAFVQLAEERDLLPAAREDELKLVEDVRRLTDMAPAGHGRYRVEIPFPVIYS